MKATLDFSDAHVGEWLRDVGYACHRLVRQYIGYKKDYEEILLPMAVELFVDIYNSFNAWGDADIPLMAIVMQDELLIKILSNLHSYSLEGKETFVSDGELQKKFILLKESVIIGQVLNRSTSK